MKTLIAFVLAFASLSAHAEWILVNTTKDKKTNIYIKKGTFALTENGAQVITKTSKSNEHFITLPKLQVKIATMDLEKSIFTTQTKHTHKHIHMLKKAVQLCKTSVMVFVHTLAA